MPRGQPVRGDVVQAPAIPFYKSPVIVGLLVSMLFKVIAIAKPEWADRVSGFEAEATQLLLLGISFLGDVIAFIGRVRATLEPVKLTASAAGKENAVRFLAFALVVPLLTLFLAACQTTATNPVAPAPTPVVVKDPSAVDQAIARVSPQIAEYCVHIKAALAVGNFVVTNPSHQAIVVQARAAVNVFCLAPPRDVQTALYTLADIWLSVNKAQQQTAQLRARGVQRITYQ